MSDAPSADSASKPTVTPVANGFQLTPPEVITPVVPEASKSAVPLAEATKTAVDEQVAKYVDALLKEDVESAAFKGKLDSAFALGREEISIAPSQKVPMPAARSRWQLEPRSMFVECEWLGSSEGAPSDSHPFGWSSVAREARLTPAAHSLSYLAQSQQHRCPALIWCLDP